MMDQRQTAINGEAVTPSIDVPAMHCPPEDGVAPLDGPELVPCPMSRADGAPGPRGLEHDVDVLAGGLGRFRG